VGKVGDDPGQFLDCGRWPLPQKLINQVSEASKIDTLDISKLTRNLRDSRSVCAGRAFAPAHEAYLIEEVCMCVRERCGYCECAEHLVKRRNGLVEGVPIQHPGEKPQYYW